MAPRAPTARQSTSDGRRRDARAHQAILDATLDLLEKHGYLDLTIEGVAARAGVGKATVYRWWGSKVALVGEALASQLDVGHIPDRGSSRDELIEYLRVTLANYGGTTNAVGVPALLADAARDPELLESVWERFLGPRRAIGTTLLARACDRGDLPANVDADLVLDIWAGAIIYRRLVNPQLLRDDLPEQLVDLVLSGRAPGIQRKD